MMFQSNCQTVSGEVEPKLSSCFLPFDTLSTSGLTTVVQVAGWAEWRAELLRWRQPPSQPVA